VKHDHEIFELETPDVLFELLAKCVLGLDRQDRWLLVDLGVAKPIAIGAINVAARGELDENEGEDRHVRRCGIKAGIRLADATHRHLAPSTSSRCVRLDGPPTAVFSRDPEQHRNDFAAAGPKRYAAAAHPALRRAKIGPVQSYQRR